MYGRKVLLLDADPDTREFYERNGRPLGAASPSKPRRPLPNVAAAVPPSTGFGNEPDSMQSVKSLHTYTPPARTSLARLEKWAKQALRFKLRIIDFRKADSAHTGKKGGKAHLPKMTLNKEREFNLTYFLEDDTIVLFEVRVCVGRKKEDARSAQQLVPLVLLLRYYYCCWPASLPLPLPPPSAAAAPLRAPRKPPPPLPTTTTTTTLY